MAPTASKPVIPQNDNVAHALAGAGGGILSMVLTYVHPLFILTWDDPTKKTQKMTTKSNN